ASSRLWSSAGQRLRPAAHALHALPPQDPEAALGRAPRGLWCPRLPPPLLLLGLLLAAAGPGAAQAKETAFVEVVLFESSPSSDLHHRPHGPLLAGRAHAQR
ncbi:E3 ubiquitin-protein ligase znrf3, partial [Saguinus oedipus]